MPEDAGHEFYATLEWPDQIEPWVERHVVPYLDTVPESFVSPRLSREAAARELSTWLLREHDAQSLASYPHSVDLEILADWPEDISQFCSLLTIGAGAMADVPPLSFRLVQLPGFSTAANSKVPHNALHDARALRDHILMME